MPLFRSFPDIPAQSSQQIALSLTILLSIITSVLLSWSLQSAKFLGPMIQYCKEELFLESVTIVTNGSLVKRDFLERYGRFIDILAVSCDSFNEQTNIEIGCGKGDQVPQLFRIAEWCRENGIKFILNTVVLMVQGENDFDKTLRDVRKFQITDQQYKEFCRRHEHQPSFVAEPNYLMAKSYLILDEYMRFLDRDGREPSASILDVDVFTALGQVYWDETSFNRRGGVYDWNRETNQSSCGSGDSKALKW
ncbi:hypothetical protein H105_03885 [Trichophyton soudanense CBS 452.61]|uniref:Radical SAM core domain-containing protein n=1 Tax=Trichophyton soudanense CBS 452.61 TaxID=1215331 RepID=A0A022XU29_TRISD|nr:hypothetical protein H105_03885 [Trichophyton soudanense CBS 452.61]